MIPIARKVGANALQREPPAAHRLIVVCCITPEALLRLWCGLFTNGLGENLPVYMCQACAAIHSQVSRAPATLKSSLFYSFHLLVTSTCKHQDTLV